MKKIPLYIFSKLPDAATTNEVKDYAKENNLDYIELEKKFFVERHAGVTAREIPSVDKAVIYARFSSAMQNEASIVGQLKDCLKYCKDNGFWVSAIYVDMAQSGRSENRVAFQTLHNAILDGKYNGHKYVVYATNRFARNRRICTLYKNDYKEFGVQMRYSSMPLSNSAEGELMEANMEAMDAYYSQNLSKMVSRGLMIRASQLKYTGGYIPYGYKVNKETKQYEIDELEAENVRMVFDMYVNGSRYADILVALKEKGAKPRGGGTEFKKGCIRDMLSNEKYDGVYVYGKCSSANSHNGKRNSHIYKPIEEQVYIPNGMPRIVEAGVFEAVQKRIESNKKGTRSRGSRTEYLLQGLVFCKECGHAFTGFSRTAGRNKTKYITYRCTNSNKAEKCQCKQVNRDYLEEYVINVIIETVFRKEFKKMLYEDFLKYHKLHSTERKDKITLLKQEQECIKKAQDNLLNALENKCPIETMNIIRERLEIKGKELKQVEQMLHELTISKDKEINETEFNKLLRDTKKYIRNKKPENLKKFIRYYIERIEIGKDDITVVLSVSNIVLLLGGDGGIRTHVRRPIPQTFYERSLSF